MFTKIVKYFLIWRIYLFLVAFVALFFIPVFGGRFPYFDRILEITNLPNFIWGFGNFDGVHYLRIAQNGYVDEYLQAFFPVFPLLIRLFNIFPIDMGFDTVMFVHPSYFYTALFISNISFLGFLFMFYKLLKLDYSEKITWQALILILVFPTSFFFVSIYSEALFLFLAVSSIYFFRTKRYVWAGILAAFASGTRFIGILIPLIFLLEGRKDLKKTIISLLLAPMGLFAYMLYLNLNFSDPFLFLNSQTGFGQNRSSDHFILLPQVIYRYIKIFLSTNVFSPSFLIAVLEFLSSLAPIVLLLGLYKRVRISYWWYCLFVILIPTLTGTFASMPRYLLAAFPLFPILAQNSRKLYKYLIIVFIILQAVLLSLFIRGYWVA